VQVAPRSAKVSAKVVILTMTTPAGCLTTRILFGSIPKPQKRFFREGDSRTAIVWFWLTMCQNGRADEQEILRGK